MVCRNLHCNDTFCYSPRPVTLYFTNCAIDVRCFFRSSNQERVQNYTSCYFVAYIYILRDVYFAKYHAHLRLVLLFVKLIVSASIYPILCFSGERKLSGYCIMAVEKPKTEAYWEYLRLRGEVFPPSCNPNKLRQ